MLSLKVTTVGASFGVILTKEAMARLRVKKGDTLYLTEAPAASSWPTTGPASNSIRTMRSTSWRASPRATSPRPNLPSG